MNDGEVHELSRAIGKLEEAVERLTDSQDRETETAERRHRELTESIAAVSASNRTLAGDVEAIEHDIREMRPLVDDYRETRDQAKGAARLAKFIWAGMVALGATIAQVVDWIMSHLPKVVIVVVLVGAATVLVALARADGPQGKLYPSIHGRSHPPSDMPMHEQFYSTWFMPDNPRKSCCNKADCYPTEIEMRGGKIFARRREDGKFILVPASKVERNRDNPDGRNHLCAPPPSLTPLYYPADTVFCFALGGGI